MNIVDRLKTIMEDEHLNVGTFATRIGVAQATISHILSGRNKNPSAEVLIKIVDTFPNTDLNWLLTGKTAIACNDEERTSNYSGNLFPEITKNRETVHAVSENRKDLPQTEANNDDNSTDKQNIIYKERPQRKITEIRIFFDDNTFETFKP